MDDISKRQLKIEIDGIKVKIEIEHISEINVNHIIEEAQRFLSWCGSPNQLSLEFDQSTTILNDCTLHADKPTNLKDYSIGVTAGDGGKDANQTGE